MPNNYITITLAARQGMLPIQAQAIPCGFFAVHCPDGAPFEERRLATWFSITHVQTGYLAGMSEGKEKAVQIASLFSEALGDQDITEQDFSTDRYRALTARWKAIATEHGVK